MSVLEETRLCLCVDAGSRRFENGAAAKMPLAQLCFDAQDRKARDGRAQILVLHDNPSLGLAGAGPWGADSDVQSVALCRLDLVGHPDFLHALVTGFDMVLLQAAEDAALFAAQQQECGLTIELGGGGRIALFSGLEALRAHLGQAPAARDENFPVPLPSASRRAVARACAAVLAHQARRPIPLSGDAPYGAVRLDESRCNLCQSCVWLCPTGALTVSDDNCELSFTESGCIQCGLCVSVCPQQALALEPRLDLSPAALRPSVLAGAAAHRCLRCGEPYVPARTLERLILKLREGRAGGDIPGLEQLLSLCGGCRKSALQAAEAAAAAPVRLVPGLDS